MKEIRVSLLTEAVIAIVAGVLFGQFLSGGTARILITFNSLFGGFLSLSIPLIILGLAAPAVGGLDKGAGKLLLATTLVAYGSTVFLGSFTFLSGSVAFPHILPTNMELTAMENPEDFMLTPYFAVDMSPSTDVMTVLLLSFTIGLGLPNIAGTTLHGSFTDFRETIIKLIEVVTILLLPLHIFGIFLNMTVSGQVTSTITIFLEVIIVVLTLHVLLLLIQFAIARAITGKSPFRLLKSMLPVYATVLETQSSAAITPATLAQAVKNDIWKNIAIFIVPLCTTTHLAGSTMRIIAYAIAITIMVKEPVTFSSFGGFVMMLGITMVAAPEVPGRVIMATSGILQSTLGFNGALQTLMIVPYIAMDSFDTAHNMMGDGAITVVVDKIAGKNTL